MIDRKDLIRFLPKPSNEDVIIYDIELKDLIDIDVLEEYNKLYKVFSSKRKEYEDYKKRIEEYNENINNVYLYKTSWGEGDYIEALKNDKRTYSTLYHEIHIIENKIAVLQNKVSAINTNIEIQKNRENSDLNRKKESVNKEILKQKEKIISLREKISSLTAWKKRIIEQIKDNEEDFKLLSAMKEELTTGKYKCKYCGSTVNVHSENSLIYKRLFKNLESNTKELETLQKKMDKLDLDLAFYNKELSDLKSELTDNIQIKSTDSNSYHKKSLEILKLEALRDEALNDIDKLNKSLKNNPSINSDKHKEIFDRIKKCEMSLENLKRIKSLKNDLDEILSKYNILKKDLTKDLKTINSYIKFISIYYKIYEQKANFYFGEDFKFKFFKVEDYEVKEILEIKYKGTPYYDLEYKDREFVDKIFAEKIEIFN